MGVISISYSYNDSAEHACKSSLKLVVSNMTDRGRERRGYSLFLFIFAINLFLQ